MDNTTYIALSRQQALWNQLEVVANNLANVNTTGFKSTDVLFTQYIERVKQNDRTFEDKVAFTHDFGLVRNLSQGAFNYTGNVYDLAIQGEGYFTTQTDDGAVRYTRAGNFTLDANGRLVTQDGHVVLGTDDAAITIPRDVGEILVQGDGSIIDQNTAEAVGQIKVVRFDNERLLKQVDGTGFVTVPGQQEIEIPNPKVAQGVLEDSNVNGVSEMTRLIALNRTYADVTRMVEQEHERKRKASDLFARQTTA
ncbi:MAG: flagellar basal-body rod protein FlgF [Rhodospirillaceae bacterium]